jgi:uncharacterized membrane-anchored protein
VTKRRRIAFGAFLAGLLLVPLVMIAVNEYALATGDRILLQARPVDPNDPFRGEYVTLSYQISNLAIDPRARPGDTVYVPLVKQGRAWTGPSAQLEKPPQGPFIRGRAIDRTQIRYGIETFYVEEGKAREYEEAIRRGELYAEVVLADDGGAKLDRLRVLRG